MMKMTYTDKDPLYNRKLRRNVSYKLIASDGTELLAGETTGGVEMVRYLTMRLLHDNFDPENRIDEAYTKMEKWDEALNIMVEQGMTLTVERVFPTCLCGCGGKTKGGRFLPFHAQRLNRKLINAGVVEPEV